MSGSTPAARSSSRRRSAVAKSLARLAFTHWSSFASVSVSMCGGGGGRPPDARVSHWLMPVFPAAVALPTLPELVRGSTTSTMPTSRMACALSTAGSKGRRRASRGSAEFDPELWLRGTTGTTPAGRIASAESERERERDGKAMLPPPKPSGGCTASSGAGEKWPLWLAGAVSVTSGRRRPEGVKP